MSYLEEKSNQNLKAAKFLMNEKLYASSVHCSYYAALQFMTNEYARCLKKNFKEIAKEAEDGKGSHNYIINGIIDYIKSTYRKDPTIETLQRNVKDSNIHKLHRKIKDLKVFRVKSDYRNEAIDKDSGEKVYNSSLEIRKALKEFLQ